MAWNLSHSLTTNMTLLLNFVFSEGLDEDLAT